MNSTQLHYREATRLLAGAPVTLADAAAGVDGDNWPPTSMELTQAQVHATLALVAAITEMTRQCDPTATEAVASAVGVLRPIPGGRT